MRLVFKYAIPAAALLVIVATLQSVVESGSFAGLAQFFDRGLLAGVIRLAIAYVVWLGGLILCLEVIPSKLRSPKE